MTDQKSGKDLNLLHIDESPAEGGIKTVTLQTNAGDVVCKLHEAVSKDGIVWVGGAGGGLDGPAAGLYPRMAAMLTEDGIQSLRLDYRRPNAYTDCVLDTLLSIAYLEQRGVQRVILVGHSFGGAVVITAGALSDAIVGIAALSSQTAGTDLVNHLSPKALLLLHGSADSVLPDLCSRQLYAQAKDPREIHLYPGCGHGLEECREAVERDLRSWIRGVFSNPESTP